MSKPRRPRLRLSESEESATSCSSLSTNCGITSVPSMKPVSQTSAIAAVDDHARVKNLVAAGGTPLSGTSSMRRAAVPATRRASHRRTRPRYGSTMQHEAVKERDPGDRRSRPRTAPTPIVRARAQADRTAHERTKNRASTDVLAQAAFEEDDEGRENQRETDVGKAVEVRAVRVSRRRKRRRRRTRRARAQTKPWADPRRAEVAARYETTNDRPI